jgi:hypothetical protein
MTSKPYKRLAFQAHLLRHLLPQGVLGTPNQRDQQRLENPGHAARQNPPLKLYQQQGNGAIETPEKKWLYGS